MAEVYPGGADERISDDEWITRADTEGWVALTKDYQIIRDHVETLSRTSLRVFSLNNANLTGSEMAGRFDMHLNRIVQRATKPGPYIYAVASKGLEHRWPTASSED